MDPKTNCACFFPECEERMRDFGYDQLCSLMQGSKVTVEEEVVQLS